MIDFIKQQFKKKDYIFYEDDVNYKLNIFAVRSNYRPAESFADFLYLTYKDFKGDWRVHQWQITTDVITFYKNLENKVTGTKILIPGQYYNCYKIGDHESTSGDKHQALTQREGQVDVKFSDGRVEKGYYGCDIIGRLPKQDKWKSATIGFSNVDNFKDFMKVVHHALRFHDNDFTFTLFDEIDFDINERYI